MAATGHTLRRTHNNHYNTLNKILDIGYPVILKRRTAPFAKPSHKGDWIYISISIILNTLLFFLQDTSKAASLHKSIQNVIIPTDPL
ncbi:hypothetical protein SAMN02910291_01415 [Desulfovibrio desulfuricans]|uniref:Uncharacterized protein n=1 Tax=Desulfovibrio desulfuricans TaxID=876 RepID=A0AA94L266_DESDE|nr:hypothetical protein SAMN02910291_01415 [Desulfovibrio desulfuricans]SPD34278.1 Hypothetical protein DSVG11_0151 [Desulfovibrio sp. G11]